MEFLLASLRKNYRRLRMQNLLLLLLRVLMILLIAFALARPRLAESGLLDLIGAETRHVILVLDASMSMSCRDGVDTVFARAQKMALDILSPAGGLKAGDSVSLVMMSDVARSVIKEPTNDIGVVRREISSARAGWGGTDVRGALVAAARMLDSTNRPRKEIFLITDLQAVGWGERGEAPSAELKGALERIKKDAKLIVVNAAGDDSPDNLAVTALEPVSRVFGTGTPAEFRVEVTNFGTTEKSGVRLNFLVNQFSQDSATLALKPGETQALTFGHVFQQEGAQLISATISEDRMSADNERLFAAMVRESVPVLLVNGEPSNELELNETYYLERALNPPADMPGARGSSIEPLVVTEFGLSGRDFTKYDLVVFANVAALSGEGTVARLEEYVRQGGAVVFFLGGRVDTAFYNEQLWKEGRGLLPARIDGEAGAEAGVPLEFDKPVHAIFERFTGESEILLKTALFRKWMSVAAPQSEDVRVVARLAGAGPAVLEKKFGKGRIILFASSCDADWNNFPKSGAYLVVIHDLLGHLVSGDVSSRNLLVRQPYERNFSADEFVDIVRIKAPGAEVVKELRPYLLQTNVAESAVGGIEYQETERAGVYEVQFETKDGAVLPVEYFVVNPPRDESDLRRLSRADVSEFLPGIEITFAADTAALQVAAKAANGRDFSRALLFALLATACVELVLAQRFGK